MKLRTRIYLPMQRREYCVTVSEQRDLSRRFGLSADDLAGRLSLLGCQLLSGEVLALPKTANDVKRLIDFELNAVTQLGDLAALGLPAPRGLPEKR